MPACHRAAPATDPARTVTPRLIGVDFSSRPTRRKPIVVAEGVQHGDEVRLTGLRSCPDESTFLALLREPGPWLGGFDLPFGLPRELVETLGWPTDWPALMRHYLALDRATIRATFAAFCDARPPGGKFAHRACDGPAGSSPSMKWVNPPVAYMLHAGVAALLAAGCALPGLHPGDPDRAALEAYPGHLARALIGRTSYKSDDPARQTHERTDARALLVNRLQAGAPTLGLRLVVDPPTRQRLIDEPQGDALDAVLCLMQAAWTLGRPRNGWPEGVDPLEGWIAAVPAQPQA
ncbi:DUF429 domain-containing protein [Leptothrix discophora]|uniref:DUF429 domain-containing protein n=1 Tax=Leptothrix discophora TaxID=89 RepID=A0ABT9FZE9_LEPDI|nr:DUF429 domain-containing protein [Leptothrix discophora]MDP4299599.1 DUF429 domain-containing protein [Leptothrix discophora]